MMKVDRAEERVMVRGALVEKMVEMLRSLEVCAEYDVEFCPSCNACFNIDCDRHGDPENCNTGHAEDCELRMLLDEIDKTWPPTRQVEIRRAPRAE